MPFHRIAYEILNGLRSPHFKGVRDFHKTQVTIANQE